MAFPCRPYNHYAESRGDYLDHFHGGNIALLPACARDQCVIERWRDQQARELRKNEVKLKCFCLAIKQNTYWLVPRETVNFVTLKSPCFVHCEMFLVWLYLLLLFVPAAYLRIVAEPNLNISIVWVIKVHQGPRVTAFVCCIFTVPSYPLFIHVHPMNRLTRGGILRFKEVKRRVCW